MERKRWWLVAVAALLAMLMVAGSIGLVAGACLAAAIGVGVLGHRLYRARHPARGPVVYCLRCGQTLPSTARQCRFCGSASWSMKN
jgi:Flp pilus assembly protein TadB